MSPTRRTRKTEQAKANASSHAEPMVPEVVSVPSVAAAPSISTESATGGSTEGNPDDQSTARIPKIPGTSIVEQARLAREETQPLPVITSEAAAEARKAAEVGAGVASAADAAGKQAAAQRPSVKAKVEKQRASARASARATEDNKASGDSAASSGSPSTQRVSASRASTRREDADEGGEGKSRPSARGILRNPDGTRPLWLKIALAVFGALVVLAVLMAGLFVWLEWGRGDDSSDIQGGWTMDGAPTAIVISSEKIILSKDAAYSYALDSFDKTITFSFVDKEGGGHYRFSLDRTQFAVIEGENLSTNERIWSDFVWYLNAFGTWLFKGEMLSPGFVGSSTGSAGSAGSTGSAGAENVSSTVLVKVEGTGAGSSDVQPTNTPSIVIERTGGSSSGASGASSAESAKDAATEELQTSIDSGSASATATPAASVVTADASSTSGPSQ